MLQTNVRSLLIKEEFEKYVDLVGYCHIISKGGFGFIGDRKVKFSSHLVLSDYRDLPEYKNIDKMAEIIVLEQRGNRMIEKLMNKHRLNVALIHIITNLRKHNLGVNARSILKAELLNEEGKVIDVIKVGRSAIPKEWRNRI